MRLSSASDTAEKGGRRQRNKGIKQPAPRPGTRTRALYDKLMANPGVPVDFDDIFPLTAKERYVSKGVAAALEQLRNFYGLDIRLWRRTSKWSTATTQYVLCGTWNGVGYTDFTDRL